MTLLISFSKDNGLRLGPMRRGIPDTELSSQLGVGELGSGHNQCIRVWRQLRDSSMSLNLGDVTSLLRIKARAVAF